MSASSSATAPPAPPASTDTDRVAQLEAAALRDGDIIHALLDKIDKDRKSYVAEKTSRDAELVPFLARVESLMEHLDTLQTDFRLLTKSVRTLHTALAAASADRDAAIAERDAARAGLAAMEKRIESLLPKGTPIQLPFDD